MTVRDRRYGLKAEDDQFQRVYHFIERMTGYSVFTRQVSRSKAEVQFCDFDGQ